jgi:DNA-binding XRE family transcriptional regulator
MRDSKVQYQEQAERAARLRKARRNHFKSMAAAANSHRWSRATLVSHENGDRSFKYECAIKYAKAFRVDVGWLWNGREADSQRPLPLTSSDALASQELSGRCLDHREAGNPETFVTPEMEALHLCQSMLAHTKELLEQIQRVVEKNRVCARPTASLADVSKGEEGRP